MLALLMPQKMFFDFPKNHQLGFCRRLCGSWRSGPAGGRMPTGQVVPAGFPGAAALVGLVAIAGCTGPETDATADARAGGDSRPRVVATTTIVADLVRQVAGDRAAVSCLLAPGIDPHAYRATPRDADRLLGADLVVASGLHLEGRLAALLERLGGRVPLVAVADRLPKERLLDAGAGIPDPHVWFDAGLWSLAPAAVARALADVDPANADHYHARAESAAARLRSLDAAVRDQLAEIPPARRVLITAHDAFRYFGRAYDVEVVGVQGTNTAAEAGLGDINRLVDLVVTRGIPAVFVETSVADRNVAAVIEGAAARGHRLVLGGRLYSDSLGEPGSDGDSLEGALAANVATIVAALAGSVAAAPPASGTGGSPP
jgi:manganese/zinc/iron transport system substrate-binding protein